MKTVKTFVILALCMGFLFNITSCVVLVREDNGKHKGWYKNPHNPHHPHSTNPGKSKGKSNK